MKSEKRKYSKLKKWAGKLHLWLGLASGIIVFIVAVTGCIFVFHDEIKDITQDWRKIPSQESAFVLPSVIQQKVKKRFPDADVSMVIYQDRERPGHIFTILNEVPHNIYFNPYTGDLLKIQNLNNDFFTIIQDLHMHLLLPEKIGKQVVGVSTLIFIVMLFTGIILWWPKQKKSFRKNLKVKWDARWRRKNYDLHKSTGVYLSIFAMFLAITQS
ncbi:PepSY domain-containing protein [Antarcticibacterium sp. 1MA-6-2]|uniref:PepSY-associated TM helix domain-containing protein n=1 Tax=Antarcticibacterium sp. 1MA-6-2 TaxID=2908210 RepID=UPI00210498DE|nr:PepSY-associated TM helix domain-containing protein [Antarcticibacterium sp. 1MA-6-2]